MWPTISILTCVFYIAKLVWCEDVLYRDRPDYSRYGPGDWDRFNPRPEDAEESSLPHSSSDDRCNGRLFDENREVSTNYGIVRGKTVTLCDGPGLGIRERPGQTGALRYYKIINVYLGIPYAEPPIRRNNLQFRPPQFPQRWNAINALHYKPSCPQNKIYLGVDRGYNNTDEDCLYLNIYTPGVKSAQQQGYPVMFYIHGGNFDHGSANTFPAHILTAQDVVVVTFNYRLGHLGFLSTSDSASVGNYGIQDQVLALRWVYENIRNFYGDRESITVFGTDAGAASAALLAMSPISRHMVKRVIAQNGSPVADWAAISDPLFMFNTSRVLGEVLGCTIEDSLRLVDCVGKRSNNEIRILEIKPRVGWLPWGPVVDNFTVSKERMFLPKSPREMLEAGNPFRSDFSYMGGTSRDEGVTTLLTDSYLKRIHYRFSKSVFDAKIREFMRMYNYSVNADNIFEAIHFMYSPSLDPDNATLLRQGYIDLLTDRFYKSSNYEIGKILVQKNIPTYLYVSNYTLQGYRPFYYSWQGISSETEYLMLTGAPFMHWKYFPPHMNLRLATWSEADREMSSFYIRAWTNFAKTGIPTPSRVNSILWEPATKEKFAFLNINSTDSNTTRYVTDRMVIEYKQKESEFWNCYLPFLIGREPPTLAPTLEPGVEELRVVTGALYGSVAAAALFCIITLVCCVLYCRARRYDSY